jgi:ribosome-associated protein
MSRDYINAEVTKILKDNSLEMPINYAMASAWIMGNFKGINLKILDLRKSSTIADVFVIGSATNPTQMSAMAEEISHQMRANGIEALSKEGLKQSTDWILLDYGDFMVHVFSESARTIYDLDHLYKNALNIEIPDSFYFSSPDGVITLSPGDKNYF